jgi:hypothetical protein
MLWVGTSAPPAARPGPITIAQQRSKLAAVAADVQPVLFGWIGV